MAQAGFTPISLYYSTTPAAAPGAGNLVAGELALNTADGKLYFKNSSNVVTLLASSSGASGDVVGPASATDNAIPTFDGTTGKLIKNNSGVTISSNTITASGGFSTASNLTFTGTGNRITGDFSNATIANRVAFQTSTTNGVTQIQAMPNGTATQSQFTAINGTDPNNVSGVQIRVNATEASVMGYNTGTGAALPLNFLTNGSERMRIDTSGNVGIGTTAPTTKLTISSNTVLPSAGAITGTNLWQVGADATTNVMLMDGFASHTSIVGRRSQGTAASPTAIQSSSILAVEGRGYGSTGYSTTRAEMRFAGAETWTDSAQGARIAFSTTTNGTTTLTERMRIDDVGNVLIGGTAARGTTAGAAHLDIFNGTAPAGTLTNGISLYSSSGDFNFMDSAGNGYKVGFRNVPAVGTKTGSYTLATGDVGKYVQVGSGGSITIPDATFAEGDVVSIFNNTTAGITITCTITTAYIAGTDSDKASVTLATRGVATILFISSTVCVITGNVS